MTALAALLCLALAAFGALGVVAPRRLLALVRRLQSRRGILAVAGIRLLLGIALLLAAPAAKAPLLVRAFGAFAVLVGLVTPLFGVERYEALLDWWSAQGDAFVRLWALTAMAFGLGLAWAVLPAG